MPATRSPIVVSDKTPGLAVYVSYAAGNEVNRTVNPINGLRAWSQRMYTGYNGPKIKPLKANPHAYYFNKQAIELLWTYDYKNYTEGWLVNHEYGMGPGLNTLYNGTGESAPSFDWDALENQALSKLNENMRGSLDLSISAFQARQTVAVLRPLSRLLHYTEKFSSGLRRRDWRSLASGISEARLEYAYGIKPLCEDLYNVLNKDPLMTAAGNIEVRGSARDETYKPEKMWIYSSVGHVQFSLRECEFTVATKYGVVVKAGVHNQERWSSLNPASILWELMPYSFVVDWVYDIGGYLRSLETAFLSRSIFVSGYQTRYVTGKGSIYHPLGNWKGSFETIDVTRTILGQYPFPNAPSLKVNMGTGRLFNAAALLGVMLKTPVIQKHLGRKVRTINENEYRKPRYFNSKKWKDQYTEWSRD